MTSTRGVARHIAFCPESVVFSQKTDGFPASQNGTRHQGTVQRQAKWELQSIRARGGRGQGRGSRRRKTGTRYWLRRAHIQRPAACRDLSRAWLGIKMPKGNRLFKTLHWMKIHPGEAG